MDLPDAEKIEHKLVTQSYCYLFTATHWFGVLFAEEEKVPEFMPTKAKLNTNVENPDPEFFDKVNDDVSRIIQKEKIQEEYTKVGSIMCVHVLYHGRLRPVSTRLFALNFLDVLGHITCRNCMR